MTPAKSYRVKNQHVPCPIFWLLYYGTNLNKESKRRNLERTDNGWLTRGDIVFQFWWLDDTSVCRKRILVNCHAKISDVIRLAILKVLIDDKNNKERFTNWIFIKHLTWRPSWIHLSRSWGFLVENDKISLTLSSGISFRINCPLGTVQNSKGTMAVFPTCDGIVCQCLNSRWGVEGDRRRTRAHMTAGYCIAIPKDWKYWATVIWTPA